LATSAAAAAATTGRHVAMFLEHVTLQFHLVPIILERLSFFSTSTASASLGNFARPTPSLLLLLPPLSELVGLVIRELRPTAIYHSSAHHRHHHHQHLY